MPPRSQSARLLSIPKQTEPKTFFSASQASCRRFLGVLQNIYLISVNMSNCLPFALTALGCITPGAQTALIGFSFVYRMPICTSGCLVVWQCIWQSGCLSCCNLCICSSADSGNLVAHLAIWQSICSVAYYLVAWLYICLHL